VWKDVVLDLVGIVYCVMDLEIEVIWLWVENERFVTQAEAAMSSARARWESAEARVRELEEALRDARQYLALGQTWITDADRSSRMSGAVSRVDAALAAAGDDQ